MSFGVSVDIKNSFFDRAAVSAWIGKKQAAFLNRAGGYVRRVARNSMKKKGKARNNGQKLVGKARARWEKEVHDTPSSPAGTPPYVHSDSDVTTLRNIQYGLGDDRESVIVGPLRLNQKSTINGVKASGTVPALHEFGGTRTILEKRVGRNWVPMGRRKPRPGQPVRKRQANYPARPYMKPALEKTAPKFPSLFLRAGGGA